jgi:hypothetical protein
MAGKLEVEGKEILIKSSNGTMAVIPKDKVSMVKGYIDSGKHDMVDKFVGTLKEFKHDNQKAGDGLYANLHAKRQRIAAGSGERMRKPGEAGAPTAAQFKQAAKTAKAEDGVVIPPPAKAMAPAESTGNVFGPMAAQNFRVLQQNAKKEKLYQEALTDKTGAAEELFIKRYNTSPHRYKYDTDPEYRKQTEKNAEETGKVFGNIDLRYTNVNSKKYANPNLAFMTQKGMSDEGRRALEESNLSIIGSALPIPGLQTVGKIPSVLSPLVKMGGRIVESAKAKPVVPFAKKIFELEGQIAKLGEQKIANENIQKSLWADVKAGNLSKEDYVKKVSQLPDEAIIEQKQILEKELRQTRVKQDIHNLPQENILQSESQLGKDISDGGSNTSGVFELGDKYVARKSLHGYDDASRLLKYKNSIKSPRIARTLQVKDINGKVYQVQEKITGTPISKLTEAEIKNIPKEHINNFWKDKAELDNLGLNIDISGGKSNIFYNPEKGFQIIDLGIGRPTSSEVIGQLYPYLKPMANLKLKAQNGIMIPPTYMRQQQLKAIERLKK